ncbi:hypothetical protein WNY78_06340 [Psychroserpens sp. AS72]|uniref:hypothetical protein n=1 Tax=Psychroserpens sp. AS72 TaxID=3135775 RepID=UPI0031709CC8
MKNLLIIFVLASLSYTNKETTPKKEAVSIFNSEIEKHIENDNCEISRMEFKMNTDKLKSALFKGTLNGTTKISLYLKEQESACGGSTFFYSMYKYDKQDKWILLDVTTDRQKKNYCMVEDNFSGALFLEYNDNQFNGFWISPSTKKQFKIILEDQLLDIKFAKDHTIIENLNEILFDDLLYNKNDC